MNISVMYFSSENWQFIFQMDSPKGKNHSTIILLEYHYNLIMKVYQNSIISYVLLVVLIFIYSLTHSIDKINNS